MTDVFRELLFFNSSYICIQYKNSVNLIVRLVPQVWHKLVQRYGCIKR